MKATIRVSNLKGRHTTGKVIYTDYGKGRLSMTVHRKGRSSSTMIFRSYLNAKEYAEKMVKLMVEGGESWKLVNVK